MQEPVIFKFDVQETRTEFRIQQTAGERLSMPIKCFHNGRLLTENYDFKSQQNGDEVIVIFRDKARKGDRVVFLGQLKEVDG